MKRKRPFLNYEYVFVFDSLLTIKKYPRLWGICKAAEQASSVLQLKADPEGAVFSVD